jgi:hypothetical protein
VLLWCCGVAVCRRIVELNIRDEDKMSEELETASYNFYRCGRGVSILPGRKGVTAGQRCGRGGGGVAVCCRQDVAASCYGYWQLHLLKVCCALQSSCWEGRVSAGKGMRA